MTPVFWLFAIMILTAATCALSGVFLVLRKRAMMADAISHSVLPGLVAGFAFSQGPNLVTGFIGAVLAGLVTVFLVERITSKTQIKEDSAIGLVFPSMFAIGVIWISAQYQNVHLDTDAVLFGEITLAPFSTVSIAGQNLPQALILILIALALNFVFLFLFVKELKLSTFDPILSRIQGYSPDSINYGLMAIVAITTVAAFTAVGAILAVALIVAPTVTALLFTRRFGWLVFATAGIAIFSGFTGTILATLTDLSVSGMSATFLGLTFIAGILFAPNRGAISRSLALKQQKLKFATTALLIHLDSHQNTSESETESHINHLKKELGWTESWIETVLRHAKRGDYIKVANNQLFLTEKGQVHARNVHSHI